MAFRRFAICGKSFSLKENALLVIPPPLNTPEDSAPLNAHYSITRNDMARDMASDRILAPAPCDRSNVLQRGLRGGLLSLCTGYPPSRVCKTQCSIIFTGCRFCSCPNRFICLCPHTRMNFHQVRMSLREGQRPFLRIQRHDDERNCIEHGSGCPFLMQ